MGHKNQGEDEGAVWQHQKRLLVSRFAAPFWRERIGRAVLFAYALHASIYLP